MLKDAINFRALVMKGGMFDNVMNKHYIVKVFVNHSVIVLKEIIQCCNVDFLHPRI